MFEVDFIPVGNAGRHGDAIAIRFTSPESGELVHVVIDAGFEASGQLLVDHFDRWYGTRDVDLAILTHPDGDHIGGMGTVVRELNVSVLCLHQIGARGGGSLPAADAVDDLIGVAQARGTRVVEAFEGASAFGDALLILGPNEDWYEELVAEQVAEASTRGAVRRVTRAAVRAVRRFLDALPGERPFDDAGGTNARNNTSIVTLLTVEGTRMLFPADAGVPALARAWAYLASIGGDVAPPDFVQIPHHGSRHNGSSDLFDLILGPIGEVISKTAYVNVAPEAVTHPNPKIANAFMRRGYRVGETKGKAINYFSADAPNRGWDPLVPLRPLDESNED